MEWPIRFYCEVARDKCRRLLGNLLNRSALASPLHPPKGQSSSPTIRGGCILLK